MVSIKLNNLVKDFSDTRAVNNINLEIPERQFVVLLGPSGCGKTTTLRLIAGLEKPTSGEIYFGDEVANDLEPKERNAAMVFQNYALYPHMTVYDNLALCLKVSDVPEDEIDKRVKETVQMLGIEDLLDRKPGELSGGQQQRTSLGRSIVREPSVYLFDEPLSNLDATLRADMRLELKELHKDLGTTTVYVTHDQTEAMTLADVIAVMKDGGVMQVGSPEEVYNHPQNRFTAKFVGEPRMNIIDCRVQEKNGEKVVDAGSFSYPLPGGVEEGIPDENEVQTGIRPEAIDIGEEAGDVFLNEQVEDVQKLGDSILFTIKAGHDLISAVVDSDRDIREGEQVKLSFDPNKIHIFDRQTGKAVK